MANYTSTPYAVHAALVLARSSVESKDLDAAEQHLRWVLDNSGDDGWLHVARLRLASVLLSKGETDSVITLLKVDDRAGFTSRYSELTGDAYHQKGEIEEARTAYQNSLDTLPAGSVNRSLLKLKRDNLGA
jgi:predicted negative regulator of RcsB-dependent stress response